MTAVCDDGAYSCSLSRSGSCSSHGGVKCWVCPGTLCNGFVGSNTPLDYTPVPSPQPQRRLVHEDGEPETNTY